MEPIIVNGDIVEYVTEKNEFIASGNVSVDYKGTKLTCQKLTLNTQTKDAFAEGDARIDDQRGVIEGSKLIYNFQTKTGTIIDSEFRANPYFGVAERVEKVSEAEFIATRGYYTTCSLDNPHYHIKSRKMKVFPGDKIQTRDDTFYLARVPLAYIPQYNHSLRDPLMHIQLMPGKDKFWGVYMLTATRYNLTENLKARIYLDYRDKLGVAEGFGVNYTTQGFGKGDYKYYYTQERVKELEEGVPAEFQRYFIRWRHKWDIDERTNLVSEYYKIVDSKRILLGSDNNILKDYFKREYEKDTQPLSYVTLHRSFDYLTLDFLLQKRVNRWYSQEEKLPYIAYTLPSLQIGDSTFYLENSGSYVNSNTKSAAPSASWADTAYNRFDGSDKISLPMKVAFFQMTPNITSSQSYTDKGTYGSTLNVNFGTGSDLSTKFYRFFNLKTNFLRLDINDLRHIITPTAGYSYTKNSIMPSTKARFGGGASTGSASFSFGLENKLQTKRKGAKVDIADFNISTTYPYKPKSQAKRGSSFTDFLFDLELRPYSWLRIDADATYKHTDRYTEGYKRFSSANYDFDFEFAKDRKIAFGQRYQRKGGNEITLSFDWRFNPKWRFSFYQRRNRGHSPALKRGLREQEYIISRDLHCWTVDFSYNRKVGYGDSVWLVFRLKAFPELEFEYNQSYHVPKPGSQSNP